MSKLINEYLNFKKSYPDPLLFYRLGSFYELYFDDAILAARQLNIVLNYKKISNQQIPTCGFPVKSLAVFSNKLLQLGFKIVIAEQFIDADNPKNLTRKINKILTPGTFVDNQLLQEENILLAIIKRNDRLDLCFGNVLLGDFYIDEIDIGQINQYLDVINPAEILLEDREIIDQKFHQKITFCQPNSDFKIDQQIFKILSTHQNAALQAAFVYIASIHNLEILKYFKIEQFRQQKYLKISPQTKQDLQLTEIIKIIDKTNCAIGKRFLYQAINRPLADLLSINARLDGVEFLIGQNALLKQLENNLKDLPDLEKLIGKMAVIKNSNIGDLALILGALKLVVKISEILFWQNNNNKIPQILVDINKKLFGDFGLIGFLNGALQGGEIKGGFSAKLDNYKNLQQEIIQKITDLEIEYQQLGAIKNLRIEFNSIIGFYFEIRRDKASKIKIPREWQLLQNLNNSIRFSSTKLRNYQLENADLEIKIKAIEAEILQDLTKRVLKHFGEIKSSCKAVGVLDLLVSFAVLAGENKYLKPIVDGQNRIEIIAGQHFIDERFVANDCGLVEEKIWLITGENMAGKSTFLRQNALIILLAQCGCFVPAKQAKIGVRKEVFSKMMVNDNLFKNQSSFMVEMLRMAEILKNADQNSLVIIDELCQTTNAIEGGKIAFGIVKYLLEHNKSLVLITTHQSNLATNCQNLGNIICKKIDRDHKMVGGVAGGSSAFEIAKMAGLPKDIILRDVVD